MTLREFGLLEYPTNVGAKTGYVDENGVIRCVHCGAEMDGDKAWKFYNEILLKIIDL